MQDLAGILYNNFAIFWPKGVPGWHLELVPVSNGRKIMNTTDIMSPRISSRRKYNLNKDNLP
jgi:hypothetical protein